MVEILAAAVLAHLGAGGTLPGPGDLLVLVVVAAGATRAVRHGLLGVPSAALLATAGQVAVHLGFTGGRAVDASSAHLTVHASGHGPGVDPSWITGDMLLAHTVAAVLTMLVLLWQDQVVARLARVLLGIRTELSPLPIRGRAGPARRLRRDGWGKR
jgi:hypothetical protein